MKKIYTYPLLETHNLTILTMSTFDRSKAVEMFEETIRYIEWCLPDNHAIWSEEKQRLLQEAKAVFSEEVPS